MARVHLRLVPGCKALELQTMLKMAVGGAMVMLVLIAATDVSPRWEYSDYLLRSLRGAIPADDPELIEYLSKEVLVPPSTAPYNLLLDTNPSLNTYVSSEMFYLNVTKRLFKEKYHGVFIEAGALDGETMSNTLRLEMNQGWTGMLIESDSKNYKKLEEKNRRAWIANVCLSPKPYPSEELFAVNAVYDENYRFAMKDFKSKAMNGLVDYALKTIKDQSFFRKVQCVPLQSLMMAANITHVDLLVLDVEGAEMDILKHLDLNKFIIDVIFLEWKEIFEHAEVADRMDRRNYRLIDYYIEDLVFVRKGCSYDTGITYKVPPTKAFSKAKREKSLSDMFQAFRKIEDFPNSTHIVFEK